MLLTERYNLSLDELSEMIDMYRPLKSSFDGHVSEYIFVKEYVKPFKRITDYYKPDSQSRSDKGDLTVTFDGIPIKIELKTILAGFVADPSRNPRQITTLEGTHWRGRFKTRTSSARVVTFSDGSKHKTFCVPRSQVDVYGVCVRPFTGKWEYMYCLTADMPGCSTPELTPLQKHELLKPDQFVQWPPVDPWTDSLETILERAVAQKKNAPVS